MYEVVSEYGRQASKNTAIAILTLDREYLLVPGNIARKDSHPFSVHIHRVKGLYNPPSPPIINKQGEFTKDAQLLIDTILLLESKYPNIKTIVCACGFFSLMQPYINNLCTIPVFTSPLLFLPMLQLTNNSNDSIGVLTLFHEYLSDEYFNALNIHNLDQIYLSDMSGATEFRKLINKDTKNVEPNLLRDEVVNAAKTLSDDHPSMKAIIVECSDMPPYSNLIREATRLSVFDYRNLIDLAYSSISSR